MSLKVYTMSVCGHRLIVGTNGKCVVVWDMRNMGYVEQRRDSSLKYQTRCIKSFPNKQVKFIVMLSCIHKIAFYIIGCLGCVSICNMQALKYIAVYDTYQFLQ